MRYEYQRRRKKDCDEETPMHELIVVVRGMNVNVRVSEDPIEGIFYV